MRLPITIRSACIGISLLAVGLVAACSQPQATATQVSSKCLDKSYGSTTELTVLGVELGSRVLVKGGWFTKPQVIVVSSYQTMTWDFSGFPADKLVGIIASGYEKPEIVGVPDGVPIRIVTEHLRPKDCGDQFSVFRGGPGLDLLADQMEQITGLQLTRFRGGERGAVLIADGLNQQEARINFQDPPEHVPPGPKEFDLLIAQGAIRPATRADVAAYNAKVTSGLRTGKFAAFAVDDLRFWQSYVVLKPVTLPKISAGYLGRYIVPAGVPRPTVLGRHDSIYFVESGSCISGVSLCPGSKYWSAAQRPKPSGSKAMTQDDAGFDDSDMPVESWDSQSQPDRNSEGEQSGMQDW